MTQSVFFGRILSANNQECTATYAVQTTDIPCFGALVRIPLSTGGLDLFGIIADISIEDDGFLRQLANADNLSEEIFADIRHNRSVPIILRIIFIGFQENETIRHLLPPFPPYTLEAIYICGAAEISAFTAQGQFGYFRHILRAANIPIAELIAAHIRLSSAVNHSRGQTRWAKDAITEIITLMRDDYSGLMAVLGALGDADLVFSES